MKNAGRWLMGVAVFLAGAARAATVPVRWDANTEPDLKGYRLYYGTVSLMSMTPAQAAGSASVTKVDSAGTTPGISVPNLTAGNTYYFRVTAINNGNEESAFSTTPPEISTCIPTAPPAPPATPALSAAAVSGHVNLSWTQSGGNPDSFTIDRSVGGGGFSPLTTRPGSDRSYQDNAVSAGVSYAYRIRAVTGALQSTGYGTASVSVPGTGGSGGGGSGGGVNPQGVPLGETIFLSPGKRDTINDSADFGPNVAGLEILDSHGRRFFQGTGRTWDGRNAGGMTAPTGVYLAKITFKDGSVKYQKLVVVK
jgi:hypothetical protein